MLATNLSSGNDTWLKDHLESIRTKIVEHAQRLVADGQSDQLAIADAAKLYAPGFPITHDNCITAIPFWKRISESISGITLVSAVLAIVFGLLGVFDHGTAQGWLDIAKIFAGAIVGSAGVGVVASARSR